MILDPTRTWFTSDTHFGHGNVIRYSNRPFASASHMDGALMAAWAERIGPDDDIFHLGDVCLMKTSDARTLIDLLPGRKRLVGGNHDPRQVLKHSAWVSVHDSLELDLPLLGKTLLRHFPPKDDAPGYLTYLHGHRHSPRPRTGRRSVDVGVDPWQYRPVSLVELAALLAEPYVPDPANVSHRDDPEFSR